MSLKKIYLGYNTDSNIRTQSSSGGLFYELAMNILKINGVVYGAAFSTDFSVEHIRVTQEDELKRLLRSKYVQSNMKNVYISLKDDLEQGKIVLFSGTPCQVKAVLNYIINNKMSVENLYLIDFVCHGVPSPKVWKSYLNRISRNKIISEINFRDKNNSGWHDYYFWVKYKDNSQLNESHELNSYMRTFLDDKNIRPSCYECQFKDEKYYSDITLGDAWKVEKEKSDWADDKGTSMFIVRSVKGELLLQKISEKFIFCETEYSKWEEYNPSIKKATDKPIERAKFFEDFIGMDSENFWSKYSKISTKRKIRYKIKCLLKITKIQKIVRRFVN